MHTFKFIVLTTLLAWAPPPSSAAELDFDFRQGLETAESGETLAARLAAAAERSGMPLPQINKGEIPLPQGADCVSSPYGCPGVNNSGNGNWSVPIPAPGAPLFNPAGFFVAGVCVNTNGFDQGCQHMTGEAAAVRMGNNIIKTMLTDNLKESLTFKFPNLMSRMQVLLALQELELETIKRVKSQIHKDLQKLVPMPWVSPEERERQLQMIKADGAAIDLWWTAAREEALARNNWSEVAPYTHKFTGGRAYVQLARSLSCRNCLRTRPGKASPGTERTVPEFCE